MSLRHLSWSQDVPEELGDSKPEGIANDQAEGPQQEGGPEHTPDGPEEWALLVPLWLQEGLCLRGPHTTVPFVPGREGTWARGRSYTHAVADQQILVTFIVVVWRQGHSEALVGLELSELLGCGGDVGALDAR